MGRVIPLETVGSYKPDGFRNNFRVGLISTLFLPISGDVARGGASDRDRSALIEWTLTGLNRMIVDYTQFSVKIKS